MEKIWEKREDESAKAFRVFAQYRNLPPSERNFTNAYVRAYKRDPKPYLDGKKKVPGHIRKWSVDYEWSKRAAAWDAYRDAQTEQKRLEEWKDFQENGIKYAKGLISKGAQRIVEISPSEIPAAMLSKWLLDVYKVMQELCQIEEKRHGEEFVVEETKRVYASGRDLVSDVIARFSEDGDDSEGFESE